MNLTSQIPPYAPFSQIPASCDKTLPPLWLGCCAVGSRRTLAVFMLCSSVVVNLRVIVENDQVFCDA